jgi:hypothetical protein
VLLRKCLLYRRCGDDDDVNGNGEMTSTTNNYLSSPKSKIFTTMSVLDAAFEELESLGEIVNS